MSAWWSAHKPTRRRLIQVYAALLYNANLKGFVRGEIYAGPVKNFCVPGFNCYSCPGAIGACPLGALQNALAASGTRAPVYVLGILMLFGLMLGRTICGWLCPLGLIQEWLHKIPTPKLKKNRFTRVLSYLKYVILVVFVIAVPLAYATQHFPVPAFCKYICPAGTLEGAMALLANPANAERFSMLNILFTRKFIIMILIFTTCVFIYRAFCRFLCPLGAIYGMFAKLSALGVKVEADRCTHCGRCVAQCKMDIRHVGDHECINCGECISQCPQQAISMRWGKRTLLSGGEKPGKRGRLQGKIAWGVMIAVLIGALAYFNVLAEDKGAAIQNSEQAGVGYGIGMIRPDFTVPLYNNTEGQKFTIGDVKDKVVVVNFWATWCTPCVEELPHFEALYKNYSDNVAVIAIHSNDVTDDVQAFLDREQLDFPIGQDETGDVLASYGGSIMLPVTVVIDREGRIVYNSTGSVTYEKLEELVKPLLKE